MEKKFNCEICQKDYKSYQSFWNHNKKFHEKISTIYPQKSLFYPQNIHKKSLFYPQNIHNSKSDSICNKTKKMMLLML
jgi:hypothetical protein